MGPGNQSNAASRIPNPNSPWCPGGGGGTISHAQDQPRSCLSPLMCHKLRCRNVPHKNNWLVLTWAELIYAYTHLSGMNTYLVPYLLASACLQSKNRHLSDTMVWHWHENSPTYLSDTEVLTCLLRIHKSNKWSTDPWKKNKFPLVTALPMEVTKFTSHLSLRTCQHLLTHK